MSSELIYQYLIRFKQPTGEYLYMVTPFPVDEKEYRKHLPIAWEIVQRLDDSGVNTCQSHTY